MRVHLFPSRTQKLSSCAPTILGGRLPGKIGNANTRESGEILALIFYAWERWTAHLYPFGVPRYLPCRQSVCVSYRPRHTLHLPLTPPPAAGKLVAIPNTEVKLMCPCCGARRLSLVAKHLRPSSTAATRSGRCICRRF